MAKETIDEYLKRTRANNQTLDYINSVMGTDFTDAGIASVFFEEWSEKGVPVRANRYG